MRASDARAVSANSVGRIYAKVYEAIKNAAECGETRVVVYPCTEWCEFYKHLTDLGYEVSEFYYHWEEETYTEITW